MSTNNSGSSVGFGGLLQLAFIVLKLTHVIDWSWWWVVSPTLFGCGLAIVIVGTVVIVGLIKDGAK